jgi:hypothetical protein
MARCDNNATPVPMTTRRWPSTSNQGPSSAAASGSSFTGLPKAASQSGQSTAPAKARRKSSAGSVCFSLPLPKSQTGRPASSARSVDRTKKLTT